MSQTDDLEDVKTYVASMKSGLKYEKFPDNLRTFAGLWFEPDGRVCAKIECQWCTLGAPYRDESLPDGWRVLDSSKGDQRFMCATCAETEIPDA